MRVIPYKYGPSKAVAKEEKGAFDVYHFKDGARLTVRRVFRDKLFKPRFFGFPWQKETAHSLSLRREVHVFEIGKCKYVVRWPGSHERVATLARLAELTHGVFGAKTRFESPVAWLEAPSHNVLVTKLKEGYRSIQFARLDQTALEKVLGNAFYELGKMHGIGVAHGHPHYGNLLFNQHHGVAWIDSSVLRHVSEAPVHSPEPLEYTYTEADALQKNFLTKETPVGIKNDLRWFLRSITNDGHDKKVDWRKMRAGYFKGFEESQRRVKKLLG